MVKRNHQPYRRKEALSCSLKDDIGYQKPELAKIEEDTKAREKRRREERKFQPCAKDSESLVLSAESRTSFFEEKNLWHRAVLEY